MSKGLQFVDIRVLSWFMFLQDDPIRCHAIYQSDVPRQGGDFDGYGKPVLLKNAARRMPAFQKWQWPQMAPGCCLIPMGSQLVPRTDQYLMAKYGDTVLDQAWNAIDRSNSAVVMQSKLCKSKPSGVLLCWGGIPIMV